MAKSKSASKPKRETVDPQEMFNDAIAERDAEILAKHNSGRPLKTEHLLGSVTKRGDREFVMEADLIDEAWADQLVAHGNQVAIEHGGDTTNRASWTVTSPVFMEVAVSEWNQIQARCLWIDPRPPTEDQIFATFQGLLDTIEAGTTTVKWANLPGGSLPPLPDMSGVADAARPETDAGRGARAGK